MIIPQSVSCLISLFIGTALMAGCSRSPQVSFYTLGSASLATTATKPKISPSVSVANITLPDLVDRPQLVERVSGNRVEILETQRWAEPLKVGIARLLAEALSIRLGSDLVTAYPQTAPGDPDYRVTVDIQRFESMGGAVLVDANWNIQRSSGPNITGRSRIKESKQVDNYDALVSAYNRAIVTVGSEIADSISTGRPSGR